MFPIQAVGRAEIHGHSVLHDAILLENLVEHLERTAPVDHEIFRYDLEPVDYRFFGKNMPVMRDTQTETNSVVGKTVIRTCRHL